MASVLSQLMGEWMDVQGLLIFLCVLLFVKHLRDVQSKNMPPGPFPFPLLGNVMNIGFSDPMEVFPKIAERYGDVSTFYLGNKPCILLTGYETFKEAFVEQADIFTDRPYFPVNDKICKGKGLIFSGGHMWRHQRRFALATLKYFGVGKKTLENSILQECHFVCSAFQTKQGLPFNPHHILTYAVGNIICSLVFGYKFEYDNQHFHELLQYSDDTFKLPINVWGRLYNTFPAVMSLLPGKHQTAFANLSKLKLFFQEEIRKHKEDRNPSSPRDYIDCYLDEIEKCKDSEAEFTEENLIHCVLDLFGAGTESTAKSLSWALLYMAKYPDVQEKVQSEIDQVIGQTRQPLMEDRTHLPYTYAVMHEVQRFANVLAFIPPRVASKDTTVAGCLIPKGVMVLPMLKPILEDKNEYSTPYEFNPAHFLDENGKFLKREKFIPFSLGKRMCPGEQLARMELFLFFISLMQRFTFLPPEGQTLSLKRTVAIASAPEPFHIRAVPRKCDMTAT
ncbi:cytochrome P450 2J4 isoform X1 [Megalobrama amblycephala]|uniref:cytochrome P450 2J4 isoform X1 n=1 Tax=Megalobrama amblycephala TaxID=75352 RepID=UPI002013FBEB|nr:cytochrome P450 2J4 isoform X1 [Megalobrama amblycephala]XP_048034960.1 cytochrome P450 2J4 isoform X1 [Megalobrama amblycephala]